MVFLQNVSGAEKRKKGITLKYQNDVSINLCNSGRRGEGIEYFGFGDGEVGVGSEGEEGGGGEEGEEGGEGGEDGATILRDQ